MSTKILILSRTLSFTVAAFLVIIPASIIYMWMFGSEDLLLSGLPGKWFVPPGILFEPGTLLNGVRMACAAVTLLANLPLLVALWYLRGLFELYSRREFFIAAAAPRIRKFAGWMLGFSLLQPLGGAGISYLSSMNNSPGNTWISLSIADTDVAILFLGGTMFLLGYVLEEAHLIAEENKGFV